MDGIEATAQLRNLGYNEPIVALTANAVTGQADMFLNNGFTDFISKPVDVRRLNAVLNRFVRDKQPAEVIEAARLHKVSDDLLQVDSMLLESFIKDAHKTVNVIDELYKKNELEENENDLHRFTIFIHGIKSSLWNIGEKELSKTALELELGAREKNIDLVKTETPEFLNELRSLLSELEYLQDSRDIDENSEDTKELSEKLHAVKAMCSDFNRKGALDILAEMSSYKNEAAEVLNEIKESVLNGYFEEAEKTAAEYIAVLSHKNESELSGKKVDGIDIGKGLEKYNNDEKSYLNILRSYSATVRSMFDVIENVAEESLDDYRIKVHGIKGSSRDIFADEIGEIAAGLEEAAKSGDLDYIKENNPVLLKSIWKIVSDLDDMIVALDSGNPKNRKAKPDKEVLSKLLAACKIYDIDSADEAMEELEEFRYDEDDGLAEWLREKYDTTRFDEMAERLSKEIN
jgi:CheY-like chemotaxis protein